MKIEYTLDKLVMDVRMHGSDARILLDKLGDSCGYGSLIKVTNWQSGKISGFAENLKIELDDGNSFYVGLGANWLPRSEFAITVRLEFNPAKLRNHIVFKAIHHDVVCQAKYIDYVRFDLAVDIPVDRRDIWMKKDQRKETTYRNSEKDLTQYLGKRANHGNVKLYNKQLEAKLKNPLSRLELTIDYENCGFGELQRIWPDVTYVETGQLKLDELSMDETERVLLLSCIEHPEYLKMLGRKMGKKIECILEGYTLKLKPDVYKYMGILSDILTFSKGEYVQNELERYIKDIGNKGKEWVTVNDADNPWND